MWKKPVRKSLSGLQYLTRNDMLRKGRWPIHSRNRQKWENIPNSLSVTILTCHGSYDKIHKPLKLEKVIVNFTSERECITTYCLKNFLIWSTLLFTFSLTNLYVITSNLSVRYHNGMPNIMFNFLFYFSSYIFYWN